MNSKVVLWNCSVADGKTYTEATTIDMTGASCVRALHGCNKGGSSSCEEATVLENI